MHALALDHAAYRQVSRDPYMTGPALLIALLAVVLQTLNASGGLESLQILERFAIFLLAVLFLYFAARVLRGNASYTSSLRVAGFASAAYLLEVLGFVPYIGVLARFIALLLAFFGVWIGTSAAYGLKGWRTILLPVVFIISAVVSLVFFESAVKGITVSWAYLLTAFGLQAP